MDCVRTLTKVPLKGFYYLSMSPETQKEMKGKYDVFGDSFTDEITPKDLMAVFKNIEPVVERFQRKSQPKVSLNKKRKLQNPEIPPDEDDLAAVSEWEVVKKQP